MKKMNLILLLLFLLPVTNLFAQVSDPENELNLIRQITELTKEHDFLASFAGKWKVKGLNYLGDEQTGVLGKAEIKTILGGHYLQIDMELSETAGTSKAKIILGFDTRTKEFTFYSIDDYENSGLFCRGKQKEKKIVFDGKDYSVFKKKDVKFKIEIERERENKFSYKLFNFINGKYRLMIEYYFFKQ